jgi:hypothetical protein
MRAHPRLEKTGFRVRHSDIPAASRPAAKSELPVHPKILQKISCWNETSGEFDAPQHTGRWFARNFAYLSILAMQNLET